MNFCTSACKVLLLLIFFASRAAAGDNAHVAELPSAAKADPKDNALRKLLKERYNEALGEVQARYMTVQSGGELAEAIFPAMQRLVQAGLELNERPADRVALLEKYVRFTKELEKFTEEKSEMGVRDITQADVHKAKFFRSDAEIQLLRAKENLR